MNDESKDEIFNRQYEKAERTMRIAVTILVTIVLLSLYILLKGE